MVGGKKREERKVSRNHDKSTRGIGHRGKETRKSPARKLSGDSAEKSPRKTHKKKMGVVFKSGSEMRGRSDAPRKCGLGRSDRPGPWRRASAASARGQRAAGSEDTGVRGIGGCAGS